MSKIALPNFSAVLRTQNPPEFKSIFQGGPQYWGSVQGGGEHYWAAKEGITVEQYRKNAAERAASPEGMREAAALAKIVADTRARQIAAHPEMAPEPPFNATT